LNKKILGLIPARGGSKGVPKKNIKLLNGYPLIWYTHQAAINSKLLHQTIVSTEDSEIKSICLNFEMDVPFDRPKSLATDQTPTNDVVLHSLEQMESMGEFYDAVCLLQPTSPLRGPQLIDKAIAQFINTNVDSLISVRKVPSKYNPHWVFEPNDEGLLKIATGENEIISRRQDLPDAYIRDGAIYITSTKVIKEQRSLYGESISYFEHNNNNHINIDRLEDWEKAEQFIRSK
jgi:CMP-N,N'-diacetyllegionaminic acid synthase